MLIQICEFLFAFLLPFQDLPRLKILGFELRTSMLLVPSMGLYFLNCVYKDRHLLKKLNFKVMASLSALALYLTAHVLLVHFNTRAAGFLLWFYINVFALIYAVIIRSEWIAKGYFTAIIVGMIHILAQRIDPFLLVSPAKILTLVDYYSRVRIFSLFGEPSFASLNILFLLCFCVFRKKIHFQFLSVFCLLCIGFTYSRMGYIGVALIILAKIYYDIRSKTVDLNTAYLLLSAVMVFLITNVFFVNRYTPARWQEFSSDPELALIQGHIAHKIAFTAAEQVNLRRYAIIRGMDVIKMHPLLGVGFGNSKEFIFENKLRPEFRGFYEGLHNLYQEIWAEVGLIGLLLFLFFIYTSFLYSKVSGTLSPYLFTLGYSIQLCQNINMPVLWLGLIAMIYFYRKPQELC